MAYIVEPGCLPSSPMLRVKRSQGICDKFRKLVLVPLEWSGHPCYLRTFYAQEKKSWWYHSSQRPTFQEMKVTRSPTKCDKQL